ncbi:NAD(P)-dependent oxidoreductase [Orbus wheelerorum]|uniref:NAD-dependent epimerase/dehydratase family protein n=1 Tax=Orbus wheelerorum TaxID=3074111 RepID=UPI00370D87C9
MKKLFLTGGTGLIGQETIPLLKKNGFDIYALTLNSKTSCEGITYIEGDLFSKEQIDSIIAQIKPDYLLHYAWLSTGLFDDNSNFDFLTASIDLLKSFTRHGGKRVVMAGTYAEYGYHEETLVETMSAEPINIYSQCKNFVQQISSAYCKNNNISFGWGRIFSAFGKETDPRRLTSFVINKLNSNDKVIINSGNLLRDYIYTKDVAASFVCLLDSNVEGVVNICTGKETSIHDYVMAIARFLDKEYLVEFQDKNSLQQKRVVGDNTRLVNEVGFKPQYTIDEGIKDMLISENSFENR